MLVFTYTITSKISTLNTCNYNLARGEDSLTRYSMIISGNDKVRLEMSAEPVDGHDERDEPGPRWSICPDASIEQILLTISVKLGLMNVVSAPPTS